ncbi:MAG: hypothetical protein U0802_14240 [Candidatus Binatia bacterium]
MARLRSYDRAGFRKIDPDAVRYAQPDFRPPAEIDASSVQPVPLARSCAASAASTRTPCSAARCALGRPRLLYTMFAVHVRADHMAPLWGLLDHFPGPGELAAAPAARVGDGHRRSVDRRRLMAWRRP